MTIEKAPLNELATGGAGVTTVLGFAMVFFGVLSMMAPLVTGVAIALMVGMLVLASGISQVMCAFKTGLFGAGMPAFLLGLLTVVAGVLLIGHPLLHLGFLTLLLIGFFLVEGIFEVVHALKRRPVIGWGSTLVGGIVSILLALMIWRQWPLSGVWAIGLLVGIRLMFSGFAVIAVASAARSQAGQADPSTG